MFAYYLQLGVNQHYKSESICKITFLSESVSTKLMGKPL